MMHYGIDVGGTKIEIALFDRHWQLQKRWREPTPAADGEALLATLAGMVAAADAASGARGTLGLGFPGVIDERGRLITANLPGLRELVLRDSLARVLDRPFALDNDSRCFIVSETGPAGAAAGARHAFGAILGTGAGGGAIVDGCPLQGARGFAGEWGHLPLSAAAAERYGLAPLPCGCGLTGCLETYVAGPGIVRLHRHFGGESTDAPAWLSLLREGEPAASRAHACHLDLLGEGLANVVKLLAPQTLVIGGGLSRIDELIDGLPAALAAHLFPGMSIPRVVRSRFGDASGVRGAAMLGASAATA